MARVRKSLEAYRDGVLNGDRVILAQAITLVESRKAEDSLLAEQLLQEVQSYTGNSIRIGITGVPGVGKSTFIDAFGTYLTESLGEKVAVLAIDPSSSLSKGSILGDKTRMSRLSTNPRAFIRPSATSGSLGGVAARTREAISLCEAAGYSYILVETVGVGQSETLVHDMVDFFLLLMLSGAGDELQGIKRGIMELCDALLINKADGDNLNAAKRAAAEYRNALHLFQEDESGWIPQVATCSALEGNGLEELHEMISKFVQQTKHSGFFDHQRKQQQKRWLNDLIQEGLLQHFEDEAGMAEKKEAVLAKLDDGNLSLRAGLRELLNDYFLKFR